ncbi:hypothetical protein ACFVU3_32010 [Streptomyces sp. NPDC058052]|uniref:hypothetical protein n=1 Tax=Streptomyces sp. NPDC058052 TaxID=3346316 RepID=UPI0036EC5056
MTASSSKDVDEDLLAGAGLLAHDVTLQDPPRLLAASFVAMEDGYQMEVLPGRRSRAEVLTALHAYARAVTGHDIAAHSRTWTRVVRGVAGARTRRVGVLRRDPRLRR